MSKHRINPSWQEEMTEKMDHQINVDTTQSFLPCIQWLVTALSKRGIPHKLYNLGAGVKRVTTDTDTCPCCKRKL